MNFYEEKIEAEKFRRNIKEKRKQFLTMICDMALLISLVTMFAFTQYTKGRERTLPKELCNLAP